MSRAINLTMSTILVIVASLLTTAFSTSVSSHLTQADRCEMILAFCYHPTMSRSRYKSIFASSLTTTSDLPTLHYSILGTSLLGEAVPDSGTLCAHLGASAKETNVEALFQVGYLLKEPPSDDLISLGLNSRGIPWLSSHPEPRGSSSCEGWPR